MKIKFKKEILKHIRIHLVTLKAHPQPLGAMFRSILQSQLAQ